MKNIKFLVSLLAFVLYVSSTIAQIAPFTIVSLKGTYLAIIVDKQINVYHTSNGALQFKFKSDHRLVAAGFSTDEKKLTINDRYYTFTTFDFENENTQLWQSDLSEMVDALVVKSGLKIVYTLSDNFIMDVNQGKAIFLDAYTGEILGFEELDTQINQDKYWYKLHSISLSGDNGFVLAYLNASMYSLIDLSIEGYGQTSQKTTRFEAVLGGQSTSNKLSYTDLGDNKYTVELNGTDIDKLKNYIRGDLPDITFSTENQHYVGQNQYELNYYSIGSSKKIRSFDIAKGFKVAHLDDQNLILSHPKTKTFQVYSLNTGTLQSSYNKTEDFTYKGTAISKSKYSKGITTIFYDDFVDNENDWFLKTTDKNIKEIKEGKLIITDKREKGGFSLWNNKIELDQFRDFEVEVSVKIQKGGKGEYGIFWNRNSTESRHLNFFIKNNEQYGVWERRKKWVAHKKYLKSPIVRSNDFNKIIVRKVGSQYSFMLNDSLVHTMPFVGFQGNKIGFTYPAGQTISVDYIKVSYLSENVAAQAPIFSENFDDNSNKWTGTKEGSYSQTIQDGYFRFENMGSRTLTKPHSGIFLNDGEDWVLEASMKFESSNSNQALALIWGKSTKASNRYRFGISKNGKFVVDHYNGSAWANLKGWKVSQYIKPDSYNKLRIDKKGFEYKFYINGKLLGRHKSQYSSNLSYGPRVGFDVPGETVAHIDYIKAWYPNPKSIKKSSSACPYYIPFLHPTAKGNDTGKLLIGRIMQCKGPPSMFKGHSKNLTYRDNVAYSWVTSYSKEDADLAYQELIENHDYAGHLVWNHALQCFEGCR